MGVKRRKVGTLNGSNKVGISETWTEKGTGLYEKTV